MSLNRNDYGQVNVINPGCLKVLPKKSEKEKHQSIAVGDDTGILQCFKIEKRETVTSFKTSVGKSICCMALGGPADAPKDKIFIARGTAVEGYAKTGKQFLTFDTNLAEPVKSMHVESRHLVLCGNYSYNHFVDCRETNYLRCTDTIGSVLCLPLTKSEELWSVVGCEDKTIQMINGSTVRHQLLCNSTPSTISLYDGPLGKGVLVGCIDGRLSLSRIDYEVPYSFKDKMFDIAQGESPIVSLTCHDLYKKGLSNILVGRADGSVHVFDYDETNDNKAYPEFSTVLSESISAIGGGFVSNSDHAEIICGTYAGWIVGFPTEKLISKVVDTALGRTELDRDMKAKVAKLQKEIAEIETQVKTSSQKQIDKIDKFSREYGAGNSWENNNTVIHSSSQKMHSGGVLTAAHLSLKDQLILCKDDGCYLLSIESQVPLDCLVLHCNTQIDLIDMGDKNSAILSFRNSSDQLLRNQRASIVTATYRCQSSTQRIEIKIRSFEGFSGTLLVYVIGRICPKTAKLFEYPIKPLSLHQRIHEFEESRPLNRLVFTGNFTLSEIHAWFFSALPEVPENPPSETSITLIFGSVLVGTQLKITYCKGNAEVLSDSVSTISVLKEFISKEALKMKKQLDVKCDINDDSIEHTLKLLKPLMLKQLDLSRKVQLIEPIRELIVQENGSHEFLSKEFRDIMRDADDIKTEHNKWPEMLKTIKRMHTDLFADVHKFCGRPVSASNNSRLLEMLNSYNYEQILAEFKSIGD